MIASILFVICVGLFAWSWSNTTKWQKKMEQVYLNHD